VRHHSTGSILHRGHPGRRLSALPDSHYLLAAEPLAATLAGRDGELRQRTGNPNYSPLDPGSLDGTDAVIFHKYLDPEGRGVA
jgi:hypothetical protein